ncbi:copper resistance protein CopC [Gottfriedia acidiceleris]|uniref:copper resistance protein CopC n=1 Tax=Gottfriedia acidiceleris TaxID=371036 RepID=UPI003D1C9378
MKIRIMGFSFLILLIAAAFFPSLASAHAYIIKSTPKENEVFIKSPQRIQIQFDESVQSAFHSLQVLDEVGNRVDLRNGNINKKNHSILEGSLKPNLPDGNYHIVWKVISSDGHSVNGVIPFRVGKVDGSSTISNKASQSLPNTDVMGTYWIEYMSLLLFVGLLFFCLFIYKSDQNNRTIAFKNSKALVLIFYFGILFSVLLSLLVETKNYTNGSWQSIFHKDLLLETINSTKFGSVWVIQILLLIVLANSLYMAWRSEQKSSFYWWLSALLIGIFLLISKAFIGHASMQNEFLPVFFDFIHLLSVSIWIGGLIGISYILPKTHKKHDGNEVYWKTIQRYSSWATISVVLLMATGIYASLKYIPNFYSLLHTTYGKVLCGKVILFLVMLLLGLIHFIKGKRRKNKLGKSVGFEISIGVIVLILSSLLTNLPTAMESPGPFSNTKLNKGYSVTLHATPNIVGKNKFNINIRDKNNKPVSTIQQVTLTFKNTDMNMGNNTTQVKKTSAGVYETQGFYTDMAGHWDVKVHILTNSLDSIDVDFKYIVGSK